jgi:type I restriction enzyme M protein
MLLASDLRRWRSGSYPPKSLRDKYGDIFDFHEKSDTLEVAFSFVDVLGTIEKGQGFFLKLFDLLDQLAPLVGADFDIFGEVYQAIGDEATKKKLGEFFTGRHIIAGVLPVLFARAGFDKAFASIKSKRIADLACGTGGFLTEMLRRVRKDHKPSEANLKTFAQNAFFGYDIGHANASRARVNMYFAGDGFSSIEGGFDSLAPSSAASFPKDGFDVIATNPPYGTSNYGRIEEAFLLKALTNLKKGTGWLLIVLPTGVLENPRSAKTRFALLDQAIITDVISLPKHAFAPYTQQRTAILIAQRRKKPLIGEGGSWEALAKAAQHEKIGMFIVDNDGFANSDKRYPTDKRAQSREWLHNDVSEWRDVSGLTHPSKLFLALINGKPPVAATNEFGEPLGPKYGVFDPKALLHSERGIVLLPDVPLRAELKSIPFAEWKQRADKVEAFAKGEVVALPLPFAEEVEFLLDHGIEFDPADLGPTAPLNALFKLEKGDTGLTEAMIYQSVSPSGSPVYGGGRGVPRFKADNSLKRNDGEPATKYDAPALVVSMDGSSGSIQVIETGNFFCNHHGAVLLPTSNVNLWCFAQVAEPALRRLASNLSASATLTKPALEGLKVRLPIGNAAAEVEKRRKNLTALSRLF